MKRVGFRGRLFLILLAFALIPTIIISFGWVATVSYVVPLAGAPAAWDSLAAAGSRASAAARTTPLTPSQRRTFDALDSTLRQNNRQAKRAQWMFSNLAAAFAVTTLFIIAIIGLLAARVAGHLSRNLSRPLQELVGWTEHIGRGDTLPTTPPRRGAPEFEVLRTRMRAMADELRLGRTRALETERAAALRETARQVAHELKNPLTPIRFAVDRLRREVPPELAETVDVLAIEAQRIETLAKSFSQFGRLPEGPAAEIDVGELARYTARAVIPPEQAVSVDVPDDLPMIRGHHDALARALTNVMLNAVDACKEGGAITVRVSRARVQERNGVEVAVTDTGCGIPSDRLARIWDPYVTSKPGGTGLGLAIARQTVVAHRGEVYATSTVGAGTEIRFVLPLDDERPDGGPTHG